MALFSHPGGAEGKVAVSTNRVHFGFVLIESFVCMFGG